MAMLVRRYLLLTLLLSCISFSALCLASSTAGSSSPTSTSQPSCTSAAVVPIAVPIQNVTLGDKTLRRGAAISIGSPPQAFAFQLNAELNNTYIFDGTYTSNLGGCTSENSTKECSDQLGGLFDKGKSTTWSTAANRSALRTAIEFPGSNPNHTNDLWGTDTIKISSTVSIPEFPLAISRGQGETMNTLGLAQNSTLLNLLAANETIPSRTWSFWHGWTGADMEHQMDGTLVLGGYDAAKVTGANITFPLTPADEDSNCRIVTITDIKMNLKNGSTPSLFGPNRATAQKACVEPHFNTLSLSLESWTAFLDISGSTYIDRSTSPIAFFGMLVEAKGAYDGDLTFTIDPGLEITIPNHQLVVPDVGVNNQGQEYIKNSSTRSVLINSLQQVNANDMLVLGLPFFTSAYMLVDDDQQTFTIWKAQPNATQDLISIGAPVCSSTSVPPVPSSTTPSIVNSAIQRAVVSKGAIAGAVVGTLAGVALFVAAFFALKRRSSRKREAVAALEAARKHDSDTPNGLHLYKPELPSDKQPPQELGYEASAYELCGDTRHEMLAISGRGHAAWPPEIPADPNKELPLSPQKESANPRKGLPLSPLEMPAFRNSRHLSTLRMMPPMIKRKPVMNQIPPI